MYSNDNILMDIILIIHDLIMYYTYIFMNIHLMFKDRYVLQQIYL